MRYLCNHMVAQLRRDVFQAIADPTRREIINLIAGRSMTPTAIADHFKASRQAVSKHIKILTECGIIAIIPRGNERICSVQPKRLEEVSDWIAAFRKNYDQQFDKLDDLLKKLNKKS